MLLQHMSTTIDGHRQSGEGFSSQCRGGSSEVGDAGVASRHRPAGAKVEGVVVAAAHPNQHHATTTSTSPQQQGHRGGDG
jgi:hypothetical protein